MRYSRSSRSVQKDQGTAVQGGTETKVANPMPRAQAQTKGVEEKAYRNRLMQGWDSKRIGKMMDKICFVVLVRSRDGGIDQR